MSDRMLNLGPLGIAESRLWLPPPPLICLGCLQMSGLKTGIQYDCVCNFGFISGEWKKKVIENRDEIMKNNICKVDESKRPAAPEAAAGEGWGIVGSFRKLTTS